MSKGNPNKVNESLASYAMDTGKDRSALYSECVRRFFHSVGKLNVGFDNKDLQAYIDKFYSHLYDRHGKRIKDA